MEELNSAWEVVAMYWSKIAKSTIQMLSRRSRRVSYQGTLSKGSWILLMG